MRGAAAASPGSPSRRLPSERRRRAGLRACSSPVLPAHEAAVMKCCLAAAPGSSRRCSACHRARRAPASRSTDRPLGAGEGVPAGCLARRPPHGAASSTPAGTTLLGRGPESSGGVAAPGAGRRRGRPRSPAGTTSTAVPRAGSGASRERPRGAALQVPRCLAPRRPAARLAEAGAYLNPGSEENGGEALSVGETEPEPSPSRALAPFPGERGSEGGEQRVEGGERSFLRPRFQRWGGTGVAGRERAAARRGRGSPGLALRGGSRSRPPPRYGCVSLRGGGGRGARRGGV